MNEQRCRAAVGPWGVGVVLWAAAGALHAGGVELYGRAHVAFTQVNDGGDYSAHDLASNASRAGIYAAHRVTPELEAVARLEGEVDLTTGDTARRDLYAGFRGEWGLLRAGHFATPAKAVGRRVDLFADEVGDSRNIVRNDAGDRGFDTRWRNSAGYRSPEIHPVVVDLVYSTETEEAEAVDGNDQSAFGASMAFHGAAAYLAVAHEAYRAGDERRLTRGTAAYDWGPVRLALLYQRADAPKDVAYGAGVRYRLSDELAMKIQHYVLDADEDDDLGAAMTAVGAEFQAGPALRLYVNYARMVNEPGQRLAPWREGSSIERAGVEDETAWAFAVGAVYDF